MICSSDIAQEFLLLGQGRCFRISKEKTENQRIGLFQNNLESLIPALTQCLRKCWHFNPKLPDREQKLQLPRFLGMWEGRYETI